MRHRLWITLPPVLALALGAAACRADGVDVDWYGFTQLLAQSGHGAGERLVDVTRARVNVTATAARWSGRVQVDFAPDDLGTRRPGTLPNFLVDLYAERRFGDAQTLRIGQFKTPIGMDFNVIDSGLDITERAMESGLVLHRTLGVMMSGREVWRGFGYDVGAFNPTGRSPATAQEGAQRGEDISVAARTHYDRGPWHAELARAEIPHAGGFGTADYRVTDVGFRFVGDRFSFKAEGIETRGVLGGDGRRERVDYVHAGYRLSPQLELVARRYVGESTIAGSTSRLTNVYLGVTAVVLERGRWQTRLQLNYVGAGGDTARYTGVRGHRDDVLLVQLQLYAEG